jgi:hypothetical protein
MSLVQLPFDYTPLATSLLAEAKVYLRIDTADDDQALTDVLSRVIAQFDHTMEADLAPTGYVWTVAATDTIGPSTNLPLPGPVQTFTVVRLGVDVTSQFTVSTNGCWPVLVGPLMVADVVSVTAVPAMSQPSRSVIDALLQLTVDWWERRGTTSDFAVTDVPGFVDRWLMTHWTPRA